jgi:hypothetical protein
MIELVICPLCGSEIYRHVGGRVETRIKIPSRIPQAVNVMNLLAYMARQETEQETALVERACEDHYRAHHRLRIELWRRLGWTWLMRWPQRKPKKPLRLDQDLVDPVRFIK